MMATSGLTAEEQAEWCHAHDCPRGDCASWFHEEPWIHCDHPERHTVPSECVAHEREHGGEPERE